MIKKILKTTISIISFLIKGIIFFVVAIILVQRVSNNKLSIANYRIFTVVTESMIPKYNIGDVLLVKYREPREIKIKDDITYIGEKGSFANKIVTHQVINIEEDENGILNFTTKGLANDKEDPIVVQSQIYGVVQAKLKIITKLNKVVNSTYGMYFLIVIPLAVVVFYEIKSFKEETNLKNDSQEEKEDKQENKEKKLDKKIKKRKERRAKRRRRYE